MWMNESEIEEAARHFKAHPVLGPATRTLMNLVEWTSGNSDGWPYWHKPAQAAARLMELVQQGQAHERSRYQGQPVPDVTTDQYRAALVPVKSFRTRMEKTPLALGAHQGGHLFEIVSPGRGVGGEVWAAEQELATAQHAHDQARLHEQATRELVNRSVRALDHARFRANWATLAEQAKAAPGTRPPVYRMAEGELEQLAVLAEPGTRLWVLGDGLGHAATAQGVQYSLSGPCVAYTTDGSAQDGHAGPMVVMTLADARSRWWITGEDGQALIGGGWNDRGRVMTVRDERFPDGSIRQGAEFMPTE